MDHPTAAHGLADATLHEATIDCSRAPSITKKAKQQPQQVLSMRRNWLHLLQG
jgi:hypothetical protein